MLPTYFSKELPLVLDGFGFCFPKLSCDLTDFRIRESGMLSENFSLMTLTVEDESCIIRVNQPISKN